MTDQQNDSGFEPRMSEQRKAFLEYKRRVALTGKPFMPYGVYHDVIAAVVVMLVIIGMTTIWFAQANCDSWWNVSCDRVATPHQQEQFTPKEPGAVILDKKGQLDKTVQKPLFGPLYEEKADPATTSYHPRPEWYFYFLFYLLVLASNPQLVILGTIGIPTLWLILLIAWPFIDRRKERRPSRRPIAMSLMVLTSIMLLTLSYLGAHSGESSGDGPTGLTEDQMAMPGYVALFEDGIYDTCQACHQLGGVGNNGPGPKLDDSGTKYDNLDDMISVLAHGLGGGAMPVKGGSSEMTDEQGAQISAFLMTLGDSSAVSQYSDVGQADWDRVAKAE